MSVVEERGGQSLNCEGDGVGGLGVPQRRAAILPKRPT